MANQVVYSATGKRKQSIARVRLFPGEGKIMVNSRDFKEYFKRESLITIIMEPFRLTNTENAYDIIADLSGGGISGQAGALRHSISKALLEINEEYRPILKREGFLTRDSRVKERKKYGLKKARKRPQFSKR
ncbi:MAG: 30S ribosomal protein S9 [Candidatus Hydromicrobium sp.]|nr:30S ribosomal protein S9 [Actinomycetota bacterium]MBU4313459.1 30S ribosomal protein S9 [Actinomycetota bacterium]PIU28499.1 MAG: 30S ribosomal protein S9 [Candidatus Hydromicrobium americanum]